MSEATTIPVTKEVRDRLKQYGKKGETYSDILRRLMDEVDYETFMERQYKKLEEKDKFVSLDEV
jgi:predicted CopG family antitoxin